MRINIAASMSRCCGRRPSTTVSIWNKRSASPKPRTGSCWQSVSLDRMKFSALVALVAISAIIVWPQSTPREPEFDDVFFRLDTGKLIPLERQSATIEGKSSGFIIMSSRTVSEFSGARSPVRFTSAQPLEFIVRPLTTAVDPNSIYVLRKLAVKKGRRELVISSAHFTPIGGSSKSSPTQGVLPVDFSKYATSSIKMITSALSPGEYAVSRLYGRVFYCFGVD